jgi:hypothetical protein
MNDTGSQSPFLKTYLNDTIMRIIIKVNAFLALYATKEWKNECCKIFAPMAPYKLL